MKDRIDEFFDYCKRFRKNSQTDWDYITRWIEDFTEKHPETAGYVVTRMSDLLKFHGYDFTPEELILISREGKKIVLRRQRNDRRNL